MPKTHRDGGRREYGDAQSMTQTDHWLHLSCCLLISTQHVTGSSGKNDDDNSNHYDNDKMLTVITKPIVSFSPAGS